MPRSPTARTSSPTITSASSASSTCSAARASPTRSRSCATAARAASPWCARPARAATTTSSTSRASACCRSTADVDPDIDDGVECATTYILEPGSTTLQVYHSLFNAGTDDIAGPMGTIADTGGNTEAWTNTHGFERADISALAHAVQAAAVGLRRLPGPGRRLRHHPAPRHADDAHPGADRRRLDPPRRQRLAARHPPDATSTSCTSKREKGVLQRYDVVVGRDAERHRRRVAHRQRRDARRDRRPGRAGRAAAPAAGARVGVFVDGNGNGMLDDAAVDADGDGIADDHAVSYLDVAADGTYAARSRPPQATSSCAPRSRMSGAPRRCRSGRPSTSPCRLRSRSTSRSSTPTPARRFPAACSSSATIRRSPTTGCSRSTIARPASSRSSTRSAADRRRRRRSPIRRSTCRPAAPTGSTRRAAPSGRSTRSRSPRPPTASLASPQHVVPTDGYLATDWHVHQVGSPDSPVLSDERVTQRGVGGRRDVRGHRPRLRLRPPAARRADGPRPTCSAWCRASRSRRSRTATSTAGRSSPTRLGEPRRDRLGPRRDRRASRWCRARSSRRCEARARRWSRSTTRATRASPSSRRRSTARTSSSTSTQRMIYGDYENADVPNDWLRLPGESLWSDQFNGLEIWNGFDMADTNGDMLREDTKLDRTMRDWLVDALARLLRHAGRRQRHAHDGGRPARHAAHVRPRRGRLGERRSPTAARSRRSSRPRPARTARRATSSSPTVR